ncbi:MAG: 3-hydroxyacyl-ACP dehydratase FabZ family protein [Bacteroidota bacterium]
MSNFQEILNQLPYKSPFLFVDSITSIDEEGIEGTYRVKEDEYFFNGHFPGEPIVPGVILIEIMAQIGLVCFGIHLNGSKTSSSFKPVFSSAKVDFLDLVKPGNELKVKASKIYFRFNKLRCEVECINLSTGQVVCRGQLDGMILNTQEIERK